MMQSRLQSSSLISHLFRTQNFRSHGTSGNSSLEQMRNETRLRQSADQQRSPFATLGNYFATSGFDSQLGATGSRESERRAGSVLGTGNWERRWREELGSSWEPGSPPPKIAWEQKKIAWEQKNSLGNSRDSSVRPSTIRCSVLTTEPTAGMVDIVCQICSI